jgi:uncharacterized protein YjbI with pentapeptide repeats
LQDLRDAALESARFEDTFLTGATLKDANLEGAKLNPHPSFASNEED